MQLRITSPDMTYESEIQWISLPTEIGELRILPGNTPMVSALKPGILKFHTGKKETSISVGKGMAFVDGKIVRIAVSSATNSTIDKKELLKKKAELEKQIKKLRQNGSIEEIEESENQLEKINSDLKLN